MRIPPWLRGIPPWQIGAGVGAFLVGLWVLRKNTGVEAPGPGGIAPNDLPLDPYAEKELADGCAEPGPGIRAFRKWAISVWGQREKPPSPENLTRACTSGKDEHQAGRAWDLMTRDKAHGDEIVAALTAPDPVTGEPDALARRAGIMYVIWYKRMWRAYPQGGLGRGEWGPYTGENNHTDHIHFSLSKAGGEGLTSLYQMIDLGAV